MDSGFRDTGQFSKIAIIGNETWPLAKVPEVAHIVVYGIRVARLCLVRRCVALACYSDHHVSRPFVHEVAMQWRLSEFVCQEGFLFGPPLARLSMWFGSGFLSPSVKAACL